MKTTTTTEFDMRVGEVQDLFPIGDMQVKDLMSKDLFTLYEDDNLMIVEELMKWRAIRHVPVIDQKNRPVGLVTHRDLLKLSISTLAAIKKEDQDELNYRTLVGNIMRKPVMTISENAPLRLAATTMFNNKIGCLPVVRGSELVGILTEADFIKLFLRE